LKFGNMRYNPEDFHSYEPIIDSRNRPCILIKWRSKRPDTYIPFISIEERDKHINAMDGVCLHMKDGEIIKRDFSLPFMDDIEEGPGGISLQ
jgi:hypothetical protein